MNKDFQIPFSEPNLGSEETEAVTRVMKSGWPSQGEYTNKFQKHLEDYLSTNVSIVNNGSSAIMSAFIASGLKPGQKVIVPDFTYVASASIPKILGADIIAVDVDEETFNIDPETLEEVLKKHDVDFVVLVDVAGNPCDVELFIELSKKYNFNIIQDSAQAIGSEYKGKKIGSFDHPTIFSFQITKLLTTIEGGCISTNNTELIRKINKIKDYGRSKLERYVHDFIGTNFRITDIQSAIGLEQLKKINSHIKHRNKIASEYKKNITKLSYQKILEGNTVHPYLLYFAVADNKKQRDEYLNKLIKNGVDARKVWTPLHMQPYNLISKSFNCKNAEKIYDTTLTLPIYNNMPIQFVEKIINIIEGA